MGLLLLSLLLVIRVWDPSPVTWLRLKVFDYYQTLQPRAAQDSRTMVVDLDEESLAQYGQWPWPRTLISRLVKTLLDSGVSAVGFDIVFSEPDRLSPDRVAETLVGLDGPTKARLRQLPNNDLILADTIRNRPVVVSRSGVSSGEPGKGVLPPQKAPMVLVPE